MSDNTYSGELSRKGYVIFAIILCTLIGLIVARPAVQAAAGLEPGHHELLLANEDYHDGEETVLRAQLIQRIETQPFNLVALGLFVCAIVHTFFTHRFTAAAHRIEEDHKRRLSDLHEEGARFQVDKRLESDKSFQAEIYHFLGEVEAVFGIWLIPLILALTYFFDWHTATDYIQTRDYTEPMFVVVIMTIAATRPIVDVAERCLTVVAKLGGERPAAWWLTILTVGPLLGSLITEPAAMTLCAMLLTKQFYRFKPTPKFAYGTLGLLFTNISVGGTLTHFAAPPVLMVAKAWGWDTPYMLTHFGWKSAIGIVIANAVYYFVFRKEFPKIAQERENVKCYKTDPEDQRSSIPVWITAIHLLVLGWIIFTNHYPAIFVATFLLFLAFYQATAAHQTLLVLRGPILVGCFLAGLVVHGGLQAWWISAVLQKVNESFLMVSAIVLTAFNDNAAITYLTTLVPNFSETMKYAVVAGAVAGGGLTVIANAPNPAGFSLLSDHFEDGISPLGLFLAAAVPTTIVSLCLALL